jgi:hypothetical protein
VICCYDIGQYDSEFVVDMLRVHRTAIVCSIMHENPYFISPKEFLRERRKTVRVDASRAPEK